MQGVGQIAHSQNNCPEQPNFLLPACIAQRANLMAEVALSTINVRKGI